jgi:hypothetical protein
MIIATHGIVASAAGFIPDADAQAFFDRVTTAGGSLSATEKTAVNQLVLDLKGYSIWSKMKAIYPMVGASAAACAQNLKSSSYTGTFTSGWTYASTGVTGNGTSAYMNTGFNPNTQFTTNNSVSIGYYSPTLANETHIAIGVDAAGTGLNLMNNQYSVNNNYMGRAYVQSLIPPTKLSNIGFTTLSRISDTSLKLYFENSNVLTNSTSESSSSRPNANLYIGGLNGGFQRSNQEISYAFVGDGLTDTEVSNYNTAVQAFQTTLSRQV